MLSLAMAAALSLPVAASAQDARSAHGGLFGSKAATHKEVGALHGDRATNSLGLSAGHQTYGAQDGTITNEAYGAPVGGGLALMLGAGLGYAALKNRRKD